MSGTSPVSISIEPPAAAMTVAKVRIGKANSNQKGETGGRNVNLDREPDGGKKVSHRMHGVDRGGESETSDGREFEIAVADAQYGSGPGSSPNAMWLNASPSVQTVVQAPATSSDSQGEVESKTERPLASPQPRLLQLATLGDGLAHAIDATKSERALPTAVAVGDAVRPPGMAELKRQSGFEGNMELAQSRTHWHFGLPGSVSAAILHTMGNTAELFSKPPAGESRTPEARATNHTTAPLRHAASIVAGSDHSKESSHEHAGANGQKDHAHPQAGSTEMARTAVAKSATESSGSEFSNWESPGEQISRGIISDLHDERAQSSEASGQPARSAIAYPQTVVRSLELILEPANLGRVQVKLNLSGKDLRIDIQTSNEDAARHLAEDRGALDRSLRAAGLDLSSMTVSMAAAEPAATAPTTFVPLHAASSASSDANIGTSLSGSDAGSRGSSQEQRNSRLVTNEKAAGDAHHKPAASDRNALYV